MDKKKKAPGKPAADHRPARALPYRRLTYEELAACLEKRLEDPLADLKNELRPFRPERLDWDNSARPAEMRSRESARLFLWAILDAYCRPLPRRCGDSDT